jgi:transcriptional regulator with XRE-family HTH domain
MRKRVTIDDTIIRAEDFGRWLNRRRGSQTKAELAKELGVTRQYVSGIILGIHLPSERVLAKLGFRRAYAARSLFRRRR